MVIINGKQKQNLNNTAAMNKTMSLTKTGNYYIRLFLIQRDDGVLITDHYGVKFGEFADLVKTELYLRDFEKRTKVQVKRYLHAAG